jgi:hypothetical protein
LDEESLLARARSLRGRSSERWCLGNERERVVAVRFCGRGPSAAEVGKPLSLVGDALASSTRTRRGSQSARKRTTNHKYFAMSVLNHRFYR